MDRLDAIIADVRVRLGRSDRAPAFDRRALPIYLLLGIALILELAALALTDFHLGRSNLVQRFFAVFVLVILAAVLRSRHLNRLPLLLESLAIPSITTGLGVTGTVLLAAVSGPFVDVWLDAADKALGFDFLVLLEFYRAHPTIATVSRFAYLSFAIQAALCASLLALSGQGARMWIFLTAWCFALAVAVLVFPFAPAAGPYALHGIKEDVFENFKQLFPWQTGPAIEALRDGTMRDLGAAARGLVSIPSFHAVGGVLFAWAAWNSRWLRWPVLMLNLALIASTVVTGAHYFVDIIAGLALAAAMILMSRRVVERLERGGSSNKGLAPAPSPASLPATTGRSSA